ncbi:MAG: XdhC family protein [Melioribacteraceae bacterium]|nr:XdhC family protein [Melioribacteraceae bacterium]
MKELKLWKYISDKILSDKSVVLLIVADASSASPGRTGFKMAIADDGTSIGTIGGGIMEFDIVSEMKNAFIKNEQLNIVRKLHHNNLAKGDKSGLICGGVQTIVFKSLSKKNIGTIDSIIEALDKRVNGILSITDNSFLFIPNKIGDDEISIKIEPNSSWEFEENIGIPNTVYVIGGGHVGLAVSQIMSTLDFYVVVFDHRKDVQTMDENIYANKKIITSYNKINEYILEGSKSYVVVVTPNHSSDKDALISVIKMDLKYIGSMGSKRKIDSIVSYLKDAGITDDLLEKIYTPIGLKIGAESPEEIAISIASEIISIKNR